MRWAGEEDVDTLIRVLEYFCRVEGWSFEYTLETIKAVVKEGRNARLVEHGLLERPQS